MNSKPIKATDQELKNFLKSHPEWSVEKNFLQRTFPLKSYFKGLSFIQTIGWLAQKLQHHPDIKITFSSLVVMMTTHDLENSISNKDLELASEIEKLWI